MPQPLLRSMMCRRKLDRKPKYEDDVDGPIDSGDKASPKRPLATAEQKKTNATYHVLHCIQFINNRATRNHACYLLFRGTSAFYSGCLKGDR